MRIGLGGGGGASGSFDVAGAHAAENAHSIVSETAASSGHGIRDAVGEAAGEVASGVAEEGACVLAALGILLAIVFGAGFYLIYDAPFVLTEAAFDFVLAAGLLKSARKIDGPDWAGSVLRTTWKPFAIALLITLVAAVIMHVNYPDAVKLSEILRK